MRSVREGSLASGFITFDRALAVTAGQARSAGLFFDFDGTLAPIQDDPDTVQPTPGVLEPLDSLSRLVARVAIVSARPVEFLQRRFAAVPGIMLFGMYGLEWGRPGGAVSTHPDVLRWVGTMEDLSLRAEQELPRGVRVEYKRLSTALHYRQAPEQRGPVERWAGDQSRRLGLRLQPGRMVVELTPPVEHDKGLVIREQTADLVCAWYFGDDRADIAAWRELREHELRDPAFTGVRVMVTDHETAGALAGEADLEIPSSGEVPEYLGLLVTALEGGPPASA